MAEVWLFLNRPPKLGKSNLLIFLFLRSSIFERQMVLMVHVVLFCFPDLTTLDKWNILQLSFLRFFLKNVKIWLLGDWLGTHH